MDHASGTIVGYGQRLGLQRRRTGEQTLYFRCVALIAQTTARRQAAIFATTPVRRLRRGLLSSGMKTNRFDPEKNRKIGHDGLCRVCRGLPRSPTDCTLLDSDLPSGG